MVGMSLLAWVPFLAPINGIHGWWYVLLAPLSLGIAAAFKAIRVSERDFWRHYRTGVAVLSLKIFGGVVLLGVIAHLLVRVGLPLISPMPAGH